VRSYRTLSALPVPQAVIGGLLSAALVVGLRRPGVTWHPAHWSPDFPPPYLYTRRYFDKAAIVWSTRGAFYLNYQQTPMLINLAENNPYLYEYVCKQLRSIFTFC